MALVTIGLSSPRVLGADEELLEAADGGPGVEYQSDPFNDGSADGDPYVPEFDVDFGEEEVASHLPTPKVQPNLPASLRWPPGRRKHAVVSLLRGNINRY